jgi:plastocyanin
MDNKVSELMGPTLMNPNEEYVVSFGGVKPGKYEYHCTPHLAMNMKGTITVQ